MTFEVKYDKLSNQTGNFYIEYQDDRGEPSGIEITDADFHILTDGTNFCVIKTGMLKKHIPKLLKKRRIGIRPHREGAMGYIIPRDIIHELTDFLI